MRVALAVAGVAVLVTTTLAAAQEAPQVRLGDRVRLTAQGFDHRMVGPLTGLTADTVVVAGIRVPRSAVIRFDRSVGQKSRWARGLGIGLVTGLAAGALVGAAHPCLDGEFTQLWCAAFFGAIGAGAGMPIGAVIGSRHRTDRWQEHPVNRLQLSAGGGTLRLGLAHAF